MKQWICDVATLILFWLGHFTRFEIIGIYTKHIKRAIPVISQQTFVLMKTSWRRLSSPSSEDVFRRRLQDVFKTNIFVLPYVFKKSSRRFQDVLKTFWRRLQDIFKTSSRHLQGVFKASSTRFEDVFKMSSRYLQDFLQRYFQDVFKAYHQVNLFFLTRPREVFNTILSTEEFA